MRLRTKRHGLETPLTTGPPAGTQQQRVKAATRIAGQKSHVGEQFLQQTSCAAFTCQGTEEGEASPALPRRSPPGSTTRTSGSLPGAPTPLSRLTPPGAGAPGSPQPHTWPRLPSKPSGEGGGSCLSPAPHGAGGGLGSLRIEGPAPLRHSAALPSPPPPAAVPGPRLPAPRLAAHRAAPCPRRWAQLGSARRSSAACRAGPLGGGGGSVSRAAAVGRAGGAAPHVRALSPPRRHLVRAGGRGSEAGAWSSCSVPLRAVSAFSTGNRRFSRNKPPQSFPRTYV